jgi:hypothetical protein
VTHLLTTIGDRWPRCPECGAVEHPDYPELTGHRPGCPEPHKERHA